MRAVLSRLRSIMRVYGKDTGVLLVGRMLILVTGFALSVILVRRFGLDAMGTYTVAAPLNALLGTFCTIGLPYALPRQDLTRGQRTTAGIIGWLLTLPLAVVTAIVYANVMGHNDDEILTIALFVVSGPCFAAFSIFTMLFIVNKRVIWSALFPICSIIGVCWAALYSTDVTEVALAVLLSRMAGVVLQLFGLPFARIDFAGLRATLREGMSIFRLDILTVANEQSVAVLMSVMLNREQLGLYGICRQILTAAYTPSWSFAQAKYPEIVETRFANGRHLERYAALLGAVMAVAIAVGSYVLAYFVYQEPQVFPLMLVMSLALPAAYLRNLYNPALRAIGKVTLAIWIGVFGLAVSLSTHAAAAYVFQLEGVVWAYVFTTLVVATVYAIVVRRFYDTVQAPA